MAKRSSESWAAPWLSGPVIAGRERVESASDITDRDALRREGFEQGRAAGLAAAGDELVVLRAELVSAARALRAALARVAQPVAQMEAALETELVRIAIAVGAHLACGELRADATRIAELIRRCTDSLPPHGEAVRVRLHPADLSVLQTVDDHAQNDSIEWLADESLQRGDCIVETRDSRVDARWRQRAAATVHAVLGEGSA